MEKLDHHQHKQLFMKQTPKIINTILNEVATRTSNNVSDYLFRQLHELKESSLKYQMCDLMHILETLIVMIRTEDASYQLPSYMQQAFIQLLNEAIAFLHTPNSIQDRLPKIINESVLTSVKEYTKNTKEKTLLIIDDDLLFLNKMSQIFIDTGFKVIKAHRGKQGLEVLVQTMPDLIIFLANLSDVNVEEYLQSLQFQVEDNFIPIIALGEKGSSCTLDKVKFHVDDFMMKPIVMDELFQKVMRLLEHSNRMKKQVYFDELTSIYSRKYIMERLEYYYSHPKEKDYPHSLVILDLDYFKQVNDQFGHPVGDKVLIEFAEFISNNIRNTDIFARYGGEEFILLFPRTETKHAWKKVEQLRIEFSQSPLKIGEISIPQTFSGGMISNKDVPITSPVDLLNLSDIALYEAKSNGRNQLMIFNPKMKMKKEEYKILIVDDDKFTRRILFDGLNEKGWHLLEATNGLEALEVAHKEYPNIILLDGLMPKMNGYEVLKQLRANIRFKQTTIIMLTGNHSDEKIVHALNAGADDYITKPFSIVELKARINRFLVRH